MMTHISIYNSQNSSCFKDKIKIARLVKGVFLKHTNYHTQTQAQTDPKLTQPNSVEETLLVRFEFVSLFYSEVDTYFVHFSQTRCRKFASLSFAPAEQ